MTEDSSRSQRLRSLIEEWQREYGDCLLRWAYRQFGDYAGPALQESLCRLLRGCDDGGATPEFGSAADLDRSLFTRVRRKCLDAIRADRRRKAREIEAARERTTHIDGMSVLAASPQPITDDERLRRCLDELSSEERILCEARVNETPFETTAGVLGSTAGALRVRWCRVRKKLRECLDASGFRAEDLGDL